MKKYIHFAQPLFGTEEKRGHKSDGFWMGYVGPWNT